MTFEINQAGVASVRCVYTTDVLNATPWQLIEELQCQMRKGLADFLARRGLALDERTLTFETTVDPLECWQVNARLRGKARRVDV
jgi:hypothetical protein